MHDQANPFFDPGWRDILKQARARHEAARHAAEDAARTELGGLAHRAALADLEATRQHLHRAERTRFSTIADYAAWRFAALPPARDGFAVLADPHEFSSLAAVDEAFERLRRQRQDASADPVLLRDAQPPGLEAFADTAKAVTSWRRFGSGGPEALISACETDGNIHICIAHRWGGIGPESNLRYLHVASLLAQETITLRLPDAQALFREDGFRMAANRDILRGANKIAARLVLYRHLLPGAGQREEFARVSLVWNGARFIEPDWEAEIYGTLPLALRAATVSLAEGRSLPLFPAP
ncbi:hypothetical protein [Acidocella sp.]|uniref:hypothetical protein n=1 Tax=Acidocella sp. TaxID=50710 RepID=UPI003D06A323